MFTSILALSTLATFAAARPLDNGASNAFGNAVVNNLCPFEVSLWSTGNSQQGPWQLNANGGVYSEPFAGAQTTIIVEQGRSNDPNGQFAAAPKVSFGYNAQNDIVWYDMDTLSGGFPGSKLVLMNGGDNCPVINFPYGFNPDGSNWTKQCTSAADVTLTLCAP
jgi:hypothetical protein